MQGNVVKLEKEHCYDQSPKLVETSRAGKVAILCNRQNYSKQKKPDVTTQYNKKGTYMLIDEPIPGDRNVTKKESEKILIYVGFTI